MAVDTIYKMITNELEHNQILLLEEVSKSSINSDYGYGEFNGSIIDAINDLAPDGPFALICDNAIKFIDYIPSKMENEHYHSIKQKEVPINFSFSGYIISKAFHEKDYEMLDFQLNRISKELDRLLDNPSSLCKKEEKGIANAMCVYINESILLASRNSEVAKSCHKKLHELEKIFELA